MKANHASTIDRLHARLAKLHARNEGAWYGRRGNPYRVCVGCDRSTPAISTYGHVKRCPFKGLAKEIAHWTRLLNEARHVACSTGSMSKPRTAAANIDAATRRTLYTPVAEALAAMRHANADALAGVGQPGNDERWAKYNAALIAWSDAERVYFEATHAKA